MLAMLALFVAAANLGPAIAAVSPDTAGKAGVDRLDS